VADPLRTGARQPPARPSRAGPGRRRQRARARRLRGGGGAAADHRACRGRRVAACADPHRRRLRKGQRAVGGAARGVDGAAVSVRAGGGLGRPPGDRGAVRRGAGDGRSPGRAPPPADGGRNRASALGHHRAPCRGAGRSGAPAAPRSGRSAGRGGTQSAPIRRAGCARGDGGADQQPGPGPGRRLPERRRDL
ncbi:MAG: hypothetical protein AVDCRST_MAG04-189, partial [uncultured Acetobacteraceae bacterium]